jgi:hypothetical protein
MISTYAHIYVRIYIYSSDSESELPVCRAHITVVEQSKHAAQKERSNAIMPWSLSLAHCPRQHVSTRRSHHSDVSISRSVVFYIAATCKCAYVEEGADAFDKEKTTIAWVTKEKMDDNMNTHKVFIYPVLNQRQELASDDSQIITQVYLYVHVPKTNCRDPSGLGYPPYVQFLLQQENEQQFITLITSSP